MRKIYCIVSPDLSRVGYARNLRTAIKIAKQNPGFLLRSVSSSYFSEGGTFGYDLPTLMICSQVVDTRLPRYYVGSCKKSGKREVFRSSDTPTEATFPQFSYVIGPFRTKRGAEFMRDYGFANPHCQTVADAERLAVEAKKEFRQWLTRLAYEQG